MANNRLESRSPIGLKIKCGFEGGIRAHIDQVIQLGYEFVCTPIVPETQPIEELMSFMNIRDSDTFTGPQFQLEMDTPGWQRHVLYMVSNLEAEIQGVDINHIKRAEEILRYQLAMCHYLRMYSVGIELTANSCVALANCLNSIVTESYYLPTWYMIKVPIGNDQSNINHEEIRDSWNTWNTLRLLCGSKVQVEVALELTRNIAVSEHEVQRWLGEPIKGIFIHTDVFERSAATGYPVLREAHRDVVKQFLEIGVCVIIETDSYSADLNLYEWHIQGLIPPSRDPRQLQLETIRNWSDCTMYKRLRKNPAKYKLYHDAIEEAIMDKVTVEAGNKDKPLIVIVAGACNGRLVQASLEVADKAGVDLRVYAVEPNFNAANTLFHLQRSEVWEAKVKVVCQDLREITLKEKADIIVYDLLGSFIDSGFAPEFLDVAQKYLKADGVMIPKNYTSYLVPIMSSTMYQQIREMKTEPGSLETFYLASTMNQYEIADMEKLFTFEHPNLDSASKSHRYEVLTFSSKLDCILHGFVGHFESTLYGESKINSNRFGLYGVPPVFFPLKVPVQVKKFENITAHFWRKSSATQAWFEWTVTSPAVLKFHNSSGCFCAMDLK